MKIVQVPVLKDNYAYLIIDEKQNVAAAVDPAEAKTVFDAAKSHNVTIESILTTHHHWDHAQGNAELLAMVPGIPVIGGDDRVTAITKKVTGGDNLKVGSLDVKVHFTPCHTTGHVLYEVSDPSHSTQASALFTGDTLFIAGCGRFFEGTAKEMYHNLIEVISGLPSQTQIYCGHEYTVKNLEFAITLEPNNEAVKSKLAWAKSQRGNSLSTIPSTVAEELTYNPFMRVREKIMAEVTGLTDPVEIMKEIRQRKDHF